MTAMERQPTALGPAGPGASLAVPETPGPLVPQPRPAQGPLSVTHVADFYRRYPGESLTLFTRVDIHTALPGFDVRISLPEGIDPGEPTALNGRSNGRAHGASTPELLLVEGARFLRWTVDHNVQPGERYEYQVQATVQHTPANRTVESEAMATARLPGGQTYREAASTSIAVIARGHYLKYLPAIYAEEDELMGRFLMLFESFWKPIEGQIDIAALYFDPMFTPAELLPWLATWVDLALDERWPEEKRRKLLASAVSLYRKRGTRHGLQEYLEIYTGAQVQITEHSANNFRLGPEARLGPGIALGMLNLPHTFTVTVYLPAGEAGADPEARARYEAERRRMIEAIIEAEKPAHTSYILRLETV